MSRSKKDGSRLAEQVAAGPAALLPALTSASAGQEDSERQKLAASVEAATVPEEEGQEAEEKGQEGEPVLVFGAALPPHLLEERRKRERDEEHAAAAAAAEPPPRRRMMGPALDDLVAAQPRPEEEQEKEREDEEDEEDAGSTRVPIGPLRPDGPLSFSCSFLLIAHCS